MASSSLLYTLEDSGCIFVLKDGLHVPLEFIGVHFKRIAAADTSIWSVGADNQVYLFVKARDFPIIVTEESFENQRWNPKDGFCEKRLPTDRVHFSSEDGLSDRNKEQIIPPSLAWQWETEWNLSTRLGSLPLEAEGWTYAVDFPRSYHPEKAWNSYVRRRKWYRRRRYVAVDTWAPVPSLNNTFKIDEPIIDIAVGSRGLDGKERYFQSVWVVTVTGKVAYRKGISEFSPEGKEWIIIPTPVGSEICQISVGPSGRVWGVTWSGHSLVRLGIETYNPEGTDWLCVSSPSVASPLTNISVGVHVVWATTRDLKVWYRKGVRSKGGPGASISLAGESWCEMTGEMSMVSVSPEDQVFALGGADHQLYFRSGVCPSEPYGKTWVRLSIKKYKTPGNQAVSDLEKLSLNDKQTIENAEQTSSHHGSISSSLDERGEEPRAGSSPPDPCDINSSQPEVQTLTSAQSDVFYDAETETSISSSSDSDKSQVIHIKPTVIDSDSASDNIVPALVLPKDSELPPPIMLGVTQNSLGSSMRELSVSSSSGFSEAGRFVYDDTWTSVSAGACHLNWENLPIWCLNREEQIPVGPWRMAILDSLRDRMKNPPPKIEDYENPVGKTSWLRTGRASWHLDGMWQNCSLELEWWNDQLGVFAVFSRSKRFQITLAEIIYCVISAEFGRNHLCFYTSKGAKNPIRLSFSGDTETEDWISYITYACLLSRNLIGKKQNRGIWALTSRGDVFFSDVAEEEGCLKEEPEQLIIPDGTLPYMWDLDSGFSPGSNLQFVGSIPISADRFSINFQCGRPGTTATRDIALHLNPRFQDNDYSMVRNSQIQGQWGEEDRGGDFNVRKGTDISIIVACYEDCFEVRLNGSHFCWFAHRLPPEKITHLVVRGTVVVTKLQYLWKKPNPKIRDLFFHQICGHLKHIESQQDGIVWGIGYDGSAWIHTRGYNGPFGSTPEGSVGCINDITDVKTIEVYENQRWNPLGGFTSVGLPTDRSPWSDVTGRLRLDKADTMLPSIHCQWISDWLVDREVLGGCDAEGWQYAVDFPSSYHSLKGILDYVRRRKWIKKCKVALEGPWTCQGFSQLRDISVKPGPASDAEEVAVWAVTSGGDLVYRKGVTPSNPMGSEWERVSTEQKIINVSVGQRNQVWCVSNDGSPMLRGRMNKTCPLGRNWFYVEQPSTAPLRKISVGDSAVWALDNLSNLHIRKEIFPTFPEGTSWQLVDTNVLDVSVGPNNEVWAILLDSFAPIGYSRTVLSKRRGIGLSNPAGTSWEAGVGGEWSTICGRSRF